MIYHTLSCNTQSDCDESCHWYWALSSVNYVGTYWWQCMSWREWEPPRWPLANLYAILCIKKGAVVFTYLVKDNSFEKKTQQPQQAIVMGGWGVQGGGGVSCSLAILEVLEGYRPEVLLQGVGCLLRGLVQRYIQITMGGRIQQLVFLQFFPSQKIPLHSLAVKRINKKLLPNSNNTEISRWLDKYPME